jgi:hypothetical protein
MEYIDADKLKTLRASQFRNAYPYPWLNPQGFLTHAGFSILQTTLPDLEMFESRFGKQRSFGQKGHDRYTLEYDENLDIAPQWHEFVAELKSGTYTHWVKKLLGAWAIRLSFHWHYTPRGCSVSPHCDSRAKHGSQIFYFNTEQDWQPEWGGETVVLDDKHQLDFKSSPSFDDFEQEFRAQTLGNRSLIFKRTNHAWHGVRELNCPEDKMRKVFIVVFERVRPIKDMRNRIRDILDGR